MNILELAYPISSQWIVTAGSPARSNGNPLLIIIIFKVDLHFVLKSKSFRLIVHLCLGRVAELMYSVFVTIPLSF